MPDETRGWRALPPALVLAFSLDLVQRVWSAVSNLEEWHAEPIFLSWVGIRIAMMALYVFGVFELAGSLSGRMRRGVQLAAAAYVAAMIETVAFAMYLGVAHRAPHWMFDVEQWVSFALARVALVGFAVAVWNRIAVAVVAFELLMYWPSPIYGYFFDGLGPWREFWPHLLRMVLFLAGTAVLAPLVSCHSAHPDTARAVDGLRRSASALWLRVVAAVGSGILIVVGLVQSDHATSGAVALAFVASAAVGVVASALFAGGLLDIARAEIADLPRWPLVVAAGGTLWCAGVTLHQLPALYAFLFRGDDHRAETIRALPVATALAMLAALATTAVTIAAAARRRGDDALRAYAASRGLAGVVLVCGSTAVIAAVNPDAAAVGGLVGMWGFALLARLCSRAAISFERAGTIPSARVVSP